ncbi:MAG TPA: AEC family transporter [Acidisoma sp.]|uniref:AEC family transporter n=1 Tax=Acidisoma sp. TaxID=1872115 RepID=UPI002C1E3829|nr:AEC family transporter [Acidisoma sp.]HTH99313.1 AEC family transporter [Acidisoma sp.]
MLTTFFIVLPIFALIFVGFICRRANILGPNATSELNRFVVYLALPALLFDIMAHTTWRAIYQPRFIAAFTLSCFIVFALTVALRLRRGRHLADVSIDGLNAAYANTGFIGFPLSIIVFGRGSLTLTTIAAIITVCVLFAVAIVLIEIGLQTEAHPVHLLRKVGLSLLRNPLLISPVLGALWAASGLHLPSSAETFFKLLGDAASPCALVALGLFLGERRPTAAVAAPRAGDVKGSLPLVFLKLIVQPVVAWVLAAKLFDLGPAVVHLTVVMAALPTGTGPFMLAEFYRREARVTANAILSSTIFSLVTVSLYLAWVR